MNLGKACFLDIPSVVSVNRDRLPMYSQKLPGYIRDLVSTRGPVVGIVPHDWNPDTQEEVLALLLPVLVGRMNEGKFRFLRVPDSDVVHPLQMLKRAMSLKWRRCSCFFGQNSLWMESLAKDLGFGYRQLIDRLVLP